MASSDNPARLQRALGVMLLAIASSTILTAGECETSEEVLDEPASQSWDGSVSLGDAPPSGIVPGTGEEGICAHLPSGDVTLARNEIEPEASFCVNRYAGEYYGQPAEITWLAWNRDCFYQQFVQFSQTYGPNDVRTCVAYELYVRADRRIGSQRVGAGPPDERENVTP